MYGNDLNRRALESLIKCGCFDGFGASRRQLMMVCQTVVDSVADHRRRNVEGQLDLFGMEAIQGLGAKVQESIDGIELPDVAEYSKSDLMRMEREVTGLYLSGHPMDEYRSVAKNANAASISDILADFAQEGGNTRFADDQEIVVAGVVESVRTKPTRNNTLMAYLTLDDSSGSIETLAFQRIIDEAGVYMEPGAPLLATGRLSARDEKAPQIVLNSLRPMAGQGDGSYVLPHENRETATALSGERTLYVKLLSEDSPEYERLKLVHMMFPGSERIVIHFSDTKKNVGTKCVIHDAFLSELREMLGDENVVVK